MDDNLMEPLALIGDPNSLIQVVPGSFDVAGTLSKYMRRTYKKAYPCDKAFALYTPIRLAVGAPVTTALGRSL